MTTEHTNDRATRFLLDELPDEERAAVERDMLADQACFDDLVGAEESLIDAYVHGALGSVQHARFDAVMRRTPATAARTEVARATRRVARQLLHEQAPVAWRSWLPLAAALVLSVAGLVLMAGQAPDSHVVTLTAGLTRSGANAARTVVPPGVTHLRLILDVESGRQALDVELRDAGGIVIHRWPAVALMGRPPIRQIRVELASASVPDGPYEVVLLTPGPAAERRDVAFYDLFVSRQ